MKYWEPEPRSRDYLERHLRSDEAGAVCHALIEAAYHDPDWRWVQAECSRLSRHSDNGVRYTAVACLGHLARIHGQLDGASAEEVLTRLAVDPLEKLTGAVSDTRDDFEIYLGRRYLT